MEQKVNISGKKGVRTISGKERAERKQQVLKLYKEGLPAKAIAYEMGRSTSLIYSIIAELKEEGKIVVNEKPFENTKVRDAVIMYMLSRRYTDREIGKFLDVSFNTIQNVKNRKETLTDEEINKIIEENANDIDLANARYIEKKVYDNETRLIELLQQNDCNNIMFTLAGLPDTVEKLTLSHESSLRVLNHIKISELSPIDRKYVIEKGIEEANEINSVKTIITDEAKEHISTLSEGYPHFIQQFAFSAFESNDDGEISEDDVLNSAFKQGGAIDAIGSRYYANAYHDQIKSDDYRQVLSIMAESMNSWIKKSEIREKFNGTENTLNNALQALTTRKIILKNSSKVGEYRLQQKGFALWIKLFGDRQKQE